MGKKYFNLNFIFGFFFCITVFSCGSEKTEDERFDIFEQKYEKTVGKFFPQPTTSTSEVDAMLSEDVSEAELLRKAEFCRKYINQLASFEIDDLNVENAKDYERIFKELKGQLKEVSATAKKISK